MSDKRDTAAKAVDELAAGAVNGQDNEERFDADEEERIEAEVERRLDIKFEMAVEAAVEKEIEERLERQEEADAERFEEAVEAEVEKRLEHFRESAEFEMAVEEAVEAARADASKFERHASNSDGPEVEIGKATDLAGILAEMREEFQGGDVAGVMAREFCDRLEKALESPGEVRSMADDCAAHGVVWDDEVTEPAEKTFTVKIRLGLADRLKLGLLAKCSNVTPERYLEQLAHGNFISIAEATFDGIGCKGRCKQDERLARTYEALLMTVYASCLVKGSKPARLTFKPAVMA